MEEKTEKPRLSEATRLAVAFAAGIPFDAERKPDGRIVLVSRVPFDVIFDAGQFKVFAHGQF